MPRIYSRLLTLTVIFLLLCFTIPHARAESPMQPAASGLPGPIVPEGLGVNIHFTDPRPGEMQMLAAAGFRWVRMDFGWEGTEREKGKYDFSAYDRLLASPRQASHPRDVHFRLRQPPLRSRPVAVQRRGPPSDGPLGGGRRYAFPRPRHHLGNVQRAQHLLLETEARREPIRQAGPGGGPALRAAEPGETYVGPATSTIDFAFLEKCFQAGLLEYWSAVSVHPYRQEGPETAAAEYARLRQLIDRYAPEKAKKTPIISGEWGYSSAWNKHDETRQGKMLPRQWLVNLANEVPLSIWYDWHDDGQDAKEPEHHFGTTHFAYSAARGRSTSPSPPTRLPRR